MHCAPLSSQRRGRLPPWQSLPHSPLCQLPPTPLSAGDKAAVDAQRALHLRIAEATQCLKNGVLVENDDGSVARYLEANPEVAAQIGARAAQ